MKRYLKRINLFALCIAVLMSVVCTGLSFQTYASAYDSDDRFSDIDKYLDTCAKNAHIPALAVSITDSENTLFSACYGECESCDTPFVLGSVSKSFTAVCIMKLAEQGKLSLDDKVSAYLPDAADGDRITVSQLLNHSGGLGEHQTLENCHIINDQGVHNYANVNYSLLGRIIECVSGETFESYVSKNVLAPLEMSHTAASYEKSMENGLTDGYTDHWGFSVRRDHRYPGSDSAWITVPAGYMSSSVNDLARYLRMYLSGGKGVISEQSIEQMFYGDTVYVEDDVPFWYGYGWATVREPLPEPVLRHSGLVETGTSCVFIIPGKDIGVAFTANVNDYFVTNEMMDSIGWGVILMLLGEAPNEIPAGAYILEHIRIDLIMLAVLLASVIPFCMIPAFGKRLARKKYISAVVDTVILNIAFPTFILLIVPLFFRTPLWVAEAFVPDVFITVIVSSALLFLCGAIKVIMLMRMIIKQR
ncbi:MAG: beta-lactamase family protein [Ruminiclostridium sp.]|nr:beta-lactamase family protein [Ruminiclostridium sp.]